MARIATVASDDDDPRQVEEKGGSLLAQISNAFVTMQKDYWGIGPLEAKSYMMDDLLLIVMRGGLTRAERTMLDFGQQDLVRNFRQTFENEMTQNLTGKIEELTGRKVLTYQSQILFDPDVVAELFVFDKAAGAGAAEIVATAEGQLRERPHGRIQDATGASTDEAPTTPADIPSGPP
jgi:uncharacterized protein YbcI